MTTRYADPRRCPDCGAAISPGDPACGSCALTLRGETAQRLFTTLQLADSLLAALRSASVPVGAGPAVAGGPAPYPAPAAPPRRHGLSAASVPKILLGLGAVCLLVAALVFLAVAWSVLGVGGRTAALVGLTALAGGLTAGAARRGVRGAAEALALVGYGLVTLDLIGADHAGWLGDLSSAGFTLLAGSVLAVAGASGALLVRRTAVARLTGAELVAAVGTALAAGAVAAGPWLPLAPSLVVATCLAGVVVAVVHRLRLRVATVGACVVTGGSWLALTAYALDRAADHAQDWATLWSGLQVWPLLVSAALVAAVALLRRLPSPARVAAAAVGELLVLVAALLPARDLTTTGATLVGLGVLAGAAVATRLLPRPWGLVNLPTQVVAVAGTVAVLGELAERCADRIGHAALPVWAGAAGDSLPAVPAGPAPWLVPLGVLALAGTARALAWASGLTGRAEPLRPLGAVVAVATGVVTLASYAVPVWVLLGALLLAAAGFAGRWVRGETSSAAPWTLPQRHTASGASITPRYTPKGVGAVVFAAAALLVGLHAEWLTEATLVAVAGLAGLVALRSRSADLAAIGAAVVAGALAGGVWTGGALLEAHPAWTVLAALLALGAAVLGTSYLPASWCTAPQSLVRAGLEVGAAVAAVPTATAGAVLAAPADQAAWTAVYLTVAGVVVSLLSLLHTDRRVAGWAGGVLLAAASWVRLWDVGVHAPEAYTLPSAAALLVVGAVRLHRDRSAGTMAALGPGLTLALLPSLLWSLAEPPGLRALLLGLGCLLLVLGGVRLGWSAPVRAGASAGAVLVLRLAAPYVGAAVPRWVLIGLAGSLLIVVGTTWERRLAEARTLASYVRRLR